MTKITVSIVWRGFDVEVDGTYYEGCRETSTEPAEPGEFNCIAVWGVEKGVRFPLDEHIEMLMEDSPIDYWEEIDEACSEVALEQLVDREAYFAEKAWEAANDR